MERIFAPWRIKYIEQTKERDTGCFLCEKFAADSSDDAKNLVLYKGQNAFILMNLYPYTNGHTMIAPKRHIGDYNELTIDELNEISILSQAVIKAMKESMQPHGFNIGYNLGRVAGAGCDTHVHMHIVPRWNGDTNFMPVLSDVRVISESIEDTYNKLKPLVLKYVK